MNGFSGLGGRSLFSDRIRLLSRRPVTDLFKSNFALFLNFLWTGRSNRGLGPLLLLKSYMALAAAPFVLAFLGAPSLPQALIFILMVLPVTWQALSRFKGVHQKLAARCNMSLTLAALVLGLQGENSAAALVWLFAGLLEAICIAYRPAAFSSLAFCLAAILILVLFAGPQHLAPIEFGLILPALIYVLALSFALINTRGENEDQASPETSRIPAAMEMLGVLLVTFDRTGAVHSIGGNCETLFDLPREDLLGRGFFEHVHVADRPLFLKTTADSAASGTLKCAQLRLRTGFRRPLDRGEAPVFIWLEMRAWREPAQDGLDEVKTGNVAAVFRDISATKAREAELEAVRLSSKEASLAKDHFLANVSHELRTPLNAIIGFSEMLADPQLAPKEPEKKREYASIIYHSGLHLLAVVNSILDMSKIQSGSFAVKPERFAILPLIDNVCDMMRLRAEESGLKLTRAYLPGCDEIVSDKHACKQILLNLLSNALKFTPAPGEVNVTAKPEGNSLLIAVSDTGIGIAPRELERLGNPFFQAQSAHDRPYEGTGLGLSIVRGLLGLQGGAIRVESEPGKGTCVIVRLPLDCRPFLGKTASQGSDPSVANSFPTEVKETGGAAAARIEILARRSPDFVPEHQPKEMMVKKIA